MIALNDEQQGDNFTVVELFSRRGLWLGLKHLESVTKLLDLIFEVLHSLVLTDQYV